MERSSESKLGKSGGGSMFWRMEEVKDGSVGGGLDNWCRREVTRCELWTDTGSSWNKSL